MTQDEALKLMTTGRSVFLTGEPGSGKTHTVNLYIQWLRKHDIEPAITASTGIAATHIGGMTIHSWSGIGINDHLTKRDLDMIVQNRRVAERIKHTNVLIIDEVSMLSAGVLSMVDQVCRKARQNEAPFGGLQVVLVGDFFQLPPVARSSQQIGEMGQVDFGGDFGMTAQQFAYDSPVWQELNPTVCYLSEQHRQEDGAFLGLLSAIRRAEFSEEHLALLETRYERADEEVTQLYSHNLNVDAINDRRLSELSGQAFVFEMESRGPAPLVASLMRGCLSPESLFLKKGSRVMFTKNDIATRKFMNGTLGTVTGFDKDNRYPIVKTKSGRTITVEPMEWSLMEDGRPLATVTQIPLRLAWAITVHKSQGMSLDAAHIDLSRAFEYGQGYVALSRVRTLAGLSLAGLNERAVLVHPEVLARDADFRSQSDLAEREFANVTEQELLDRQKVFIQQCGGSIEEIGSERLKSKKAGLRTKVSTYNKTKEMILRGMSVSQIAKERDLTEGTVIDHVEKLLEEKSIDYKKDLLHVADGQEVLMDEIAKAFDKLGTSPLKPVFEYMKGHVPYEKLRLARVLYRGERVGVIKN